MTLSLVIGTGPHHRWVQGRVLRFFGEISYGLYLVHLLCFIAYDAAVTRWVAGVSPVDVRLGPMLVRFAVAAGAATLLATLSRRTYEAWFLARSPRRAFPPGPPRRVPAVPAPADVLCQEVGRGAPRRARRDGSSDGP